jgi:hypothetical protein
MKVPPDRVVTKPLFNSDVAPAPYPPVPTWYI